MKKGLLTLLSIGTLLALPACRQQKSPDEIDYETRKEKREMHRKNRETTRKVQTKKEKRSADVRNREDERRAQTQQERQRTEFENKKDKLRTQDARNMGNYPAQRRVSSY